MKLRFMNIKVSTQIPSIFSRSEKKWKNLSTLTILQCKCCQVSMCACWGANYNKSNPEINQKNLVTIS